MPPPGEVLSPEVRYQESNFEDPNKKKRPLPKNTAKKAPFRPSSAAISGAIVSGGQIWFVRAGWIGALG